MAHRRFVPMPERPNVARRFTRKRTVFAISDCTQFCPNDVAATRKFASPGKVTALMKNKMMTARDYYRKSFSEDLLP
jgi:hypothetical protein